MVVRIIIILFLSCIGIPICTFTIGFLTYKKEMLRRFSESVLKKNAALTTIKEDLKTQKYLDYMTGRLDVTQEVLDMFK